MKDCKSPPDTMRILLIVLLLVAAASANSLRRVKRGKSFLTLLSVRDAAFETLQTAFAWLLFCLAPCVSGIRESCTYINIIVLIWNAISV